MNENRGTSRLEQGNGGRQGRKRDCHNSHKTALTSVDTGDQYDI